MTRWVRHNGPVSEAAARKSKVAQITGNPFVGPVIYVAVMTMFLWTQHRGPVLSSIVAAIAFAAWMLFTQLQSRHHDPDDELAESHYASKDVYSTPPLRSVSEAARAEGLRRRGR